MFISFGAMVNPTPANDPSSSKPIQLVADETPPTPLKCFTGALFSGALATAAYYMTLSIHSTFAGKALPTSSPFATNIASAVRTLVLGVSALAMVTLGIATLGLFALGVQLLFQKKRAK